jgi:hypothetical protein
MHTRPPSYRYCMTLLYDMIPSYPTSPDRAICPSHPVARVGGYDRLFPFSAESMSNGEGEEGMHEWVNRQTPCKRRGRPSGTLYSYTVIMKEQKGKRK